jgi:hypothetical protein
MAGAGLSWVTEVSKATSLWGCSVFVDAFVAQRLGVPPHTGHTTTTTTHARMAARATRGVEGFA